MLLLLALACPADDLKNALLRRRLGYYVAESMPTVSDLRRKDQAWKEVALPPPPSAGPAGPAGAAEEHLLLLPNAAAAGLLLDTYVRVWLWLYICGLTYMLC